MAVKKIPDGYRTVTPYLVNRDVGKVIAFAKEVFDAKELFPPMKREDGTIMHAEVRIGDSAVMMGEASGASGPIPAMLYLYVDDVDATYRKAVQAGATSVSEPKNQFYGDRSAAVKDAAGNLWYVATHVEDVPPDEMERRSKAAMAQPSGA
jgi:uncharacterized glyoxalase superfamily protein PhnB